MGIFSIIGSFMIIIRIPLLHMYSPSACTSIASLTSSLVVQIMYTVVILADKSLLVKSLERNSSFNEDLAKYPRPTVQ